MSRAFVHRVRLTSSLLLKAIGLEDRQKAVICRPRTLWSRDRTVNRSGEYSLLATT